MSQPLVVQFADGDQTMADLLGGKGANLAQMTRMGLPVPHGFVITTQACHGYLQYGTVPASLTAEVTSAMAALETATGRRLGAADDPLLVSVRSGARFSMPGMMETVLNVGLSDTSVDALGARAGQGFAWDCYRRLVQMYGHTVLGVEPGLFEAALARACGEEGASDATSLSVSALRDLVLSFRRLLKEHAGEDLPQDPREQLDRSITAVFESWNSARARLYRHHEGIPDDLGTAVSVVQMVYGNTGAHSGSGVCFTRDPASGEPLPYGDYLRNAQGEDVVNGSRVTVSFTEFARLEPQAHAKLVTHLRQLEHQYRDLCDVEFTVEDGTLWILQTRVGKRTPAAAFRIAHDLAQEGVISLDEALSRVDGHQLETLLHPRFEEPEGQTALAQGLAASPGASVGEAVFDPSTAVAFAADGRSVVLVRPETSAEDLEGILACEAVVTAHGGLASHAAVVARGLGRTCVTSVEGLLVEPADRQARTASGHVISEGDLLSVDGTTGRVYAGRLPIQDSPVAAALSGADAGLQESPESEPLLRSVRAILAQADARRQMRILANAETAREARQARLAGAQGIGLCRTEHMLLGARRTLVEQVITDHDRGSALVEIERLAVEEFTALMRVMDGLPVVVRLLDPPLHEFLPDPQDLAVQVAHQEARGVVDPDLADRLRAVRRWSEANPMLGLRGVRLLTVVPELVDAHVRALVTAADALLKEGLDPKPEIMVPLVAHEAELVSARSRITAQVEKTCRDLGADVTVPIGVMIELPRAALIAGDLASRADFFSFGTNDLTQTTWGISRDDAQTSFLSAYRTTGLLTVDPFETLDTVGVGELVQTAVTRGRTTSPHLGLGVCGEHAGDPASIPFFARLGIDYLSCSPPRVAIARLEAGRAAVQASGTQAMSDTR